MAFLQATALRSGFRSARPAIARQTQRLGQSTRRRYASHIPSPKSSDAPWAIGAVAVTVPLCFLLLRSSPPEAHHLHTPTHIPTHKHEKEPVEEVKTEKVEEKAKETPEEKHEEKVETTAEPADAPPSEAPSEVDAAQASEKGESSTADAASEKGEQDAVSENITKSDEEKQIPGKKVEEPKDTKTET